MTKGLRLEDCTWKSIKNEPVRPVRGDEAVAVLCFLADDARKFLVQRKPLLTLLSADIVRSNKKIMDPAITAIAR